MLPNVSAAIATWESAYTVKTVTTTTVDFLPVTSISTRVQLLMAQVADKESLQMDTLDWSLEYLMVHSRFPLQMEEIIVYKGRDFVIVRRGEWSDYGYFEVVAEEMKRASV